MYPSVDTTSEESVIHIVVSWLQSHTAYVVLSAFVFSCKLYLTIVSTQPVPRVINL
jgi:hypothetical protein